MDSRRSVLNLADLTRPFRRHARSGSVPLAGGELGQISHRIPPERPGRRRCPNSGVLPRIAFSSTEIFYAFEASGMRMRVQNERQGPAFADSVRSSPQLKLPRNRSIRPRAGNLYGPNLVTVELVVVRIVSVVDRAGRGEFREGPHLSPRAFAERPDERSLFLAQRSPDVFFGGRFKTTGPRVDREVSSQESSESQTPSLAILGISNVSCYASDNIYRISPDRQ